MLRLRALLAVLAFIAHGCGDSAETGPSLNVREVCTSWVESWYHCNSFGIHGFKQDAIGDCIDRATAPGVSPGSIEALARCAEAMTECTFTSTTAEACQQPAGSMPEGSACLYGTQCESWRCELGPGNSCGTCGEALPPDAPASWVKPGSACDPGINCDDGAYCIDGICQLPPEHRPCSDEIDCPLLEVCLEGSCVPAPGPGEPCPDYRCSARARCTRSGVCLLITIAGPGAPCGSETATYCEVGACHQPFPDEVGKCPAVLGQGSRCFEGDLGRVCDLGLQCEGEVCITQYAGACE